MKLNEIQLKIRLDADLIEALDRVAAQKHQSRDQLITILLRSYLQKDKS